MTATVREAAPADASEIEALYELLTGRACSVLPRRISQITADDNTFLFVAESGGHVVGTVFLALCLDAMYANQPFGVVENLVVSSSSRNAGIGTSLMHHVETCCLKHECSKIMLLSASERVDAHRFFSRLGFARETKVGFVKYRSELLAGAAQT